MDICRDFKTYKEVKNVRAKRQTVQVDGAAQVADCHRKGDQ